MTARKTLDALLRTDPTAADRLVRLLAAEPPSPTITDAAMAVPHFYRLLGGREYEAFAVMALNRRNRMFDIEVLTTGSDGFTIVDPKMVFRWALTRRSPVTSIIIAHNHPSGDASPSVQDREVTERVRSAGRMLGIPVLDHIIITDDPQVWGGVN